MNSCRTPGCHRAPILLTLSLVTTLALAQAPAATPSAAVPNTPAAAPASAAVSAAPAAVTPSAAAPAPDEASSYSIGVVLGSQLRGGGLDDTLKMDAVMHGLKDGLSGKPLDPVDKERAMQLMRSGHDAAAARNKAAAHEFLAKNGKEEGMTTTASGLQYQVFEAGDAKGASPALTDRVTVNYRGRLLDGTEFDNSDKHAQAATFGLNGMIKGWREALPMMKPHAKWRLFIPPELAYEFNSPPSIPPGSLLIFDIELLKVEPAPVMAPQGPQQGKGTKSPVTRKPVAPKPPTVPDSKR